MDSGDDDIWYQVGYVLERVRGAPRKLPALETLQRSRGASGTGGSSGNPGHGKDDPVAGLASTVLRSLGTRVLGLWPSRGSPGVLGLAAAAGSGAAAALLTDLVRPLLRSARDGSVADAPDRGSSALEGVGRGLTYAALVRPRVPGPAFLAGFLYGTVEYVASPWGGLPRLLRAGSPHGRLPLASELLEPDPELDADYLEHLAFGLALALLYDLVHDANRGIREEE